MDSNQPILFFKESAFPAGDISVALGIPGTPVFVLEGEEISGKAELLAAFNRIMDFPYFGFNWDALEDNLSDPRIVPENGYILVLKYLERFACENPSDYRILFGILKSVWKRWKSWGKGSFVVVVVDRI